VVLELRAEGNTVHAGGEQEEDIAEEVVAGTGEAQTAEDGKEVLNAEDHPVLSERSLRCCSCSQNASSY